MSAPRPSRAGLGLLEVLISLALLALIAGGLSGALGLGLRLNERSQAAVAEQDELALRVRLRHWLMTAIPPERIAHVPAVFEGAPDAVTFTTAPPDALAPTAAVLRVRVSAADGALMLLAEALDDDGTAVWRDERPLVRDVRGLAFTYYDAERDEWSATWSDRPGLPALVRIEAEEGSRPPWPELTVRPRLGAPVP